MRTVTLTHEIRCNAEVFWKIFFDKEFNETLYRNELKFPEFSILEQRETETEIWRKVSGKPQMKMPAAVEKVLGSGFRYTEETRMQKGTNKSHWKIVTSTMPDKITNEGTVRIEPVGDSSVRRIVELKLEAKIFGIGGMIETAAEKEFRDGWNASADYMNQWALRKA